MYLKVDFLLRKQKQMHNIRDLWLTKEIQFAIYDYK